MKFFLSSYQFGDSVDEFLELVKDTNKRVAYISNARDYEPNPEKEKWDLDQLKEMQLSFDKIDLRNYFGKEQDLRKVLDKYDIIYIRGGNTFALRKAMKLSGLDNILLDYAKQNTDKVYIGYSAGACVLCKDIEPLKLMDDIDVNPYDDEKPMTKGLGIIEFLFIPHFESEYLPEGMAQRAIDYAKDKGIECKWFRDNEYMIFNI